MPPFSAGPLVAADAICQQEAADAGLDQPGSFKAWLSTEGGAGRVSVPGAGVAAKDRFLNDGPWIRTDGVRIASGLSDLTDGTLATAIDRHADGSLALDGLSNVWTGTQRTGLPLNGLHCSNWTSSDSDETALTGERQLADHRWTEETSPCSSELALYCFSDAPAEVSIFEDGFESGDMDRWSSALP